MRFDPQGNADHIQSIVTRASKGLSPHESQVLHSAVSNQAPWLEWAGKRESLERGSFSVDPVALQIHERISTQAILSAAKRESPQRDLFADTTLPYNEQVKFYLHDIDWTNRFILGDSLQVMNSLALKENLAGQVQMIFIDPPYGIRFGSNFQPELGRREVKDRPGDITREAEMVKAYRDTWTLGVHSYLEYLRQRLIVAKSLLTESGSVFVQISDANIHHVREVMDEVFLSENSCGLIVFRTTGGQSTSLLSTSTDFLLWYAKDKQAAKEPVA